MPRFGAVQLFAPRYAQLVVQQCKIVCTYLPVHDKCVYRNYYLLLDRGTVITTENFLSLFKKRNRDEYIFFNLITVNRIRLSFSTINYKSRWKTDVHYERKTEGKRKGDKGKKYMKIKELMVTESFCATVQNIWQCVVKDTKGEPIVHFFVQKRSKYLE